MDRSEMYKITSSVILGIMANIYDKYSLMLMFMSLAIVFDVITGIVKTKYKGEKLTSKKGTKGFFKKLVFIIAYGFGVFLDFFIPYAIATTGIEMKINCCFGLIIGAYITLNESISICENLYTCNSDILPPFVVDIVKKIKDKITKK